MVPAPVGRRHPWEFALSALALMVASDYKLRVRDPASTLGGGVDVFVLLEIGLYGLVALRLLLTAPRLPVPRRVPPVVHLCCCYVGLLAVGATWSPYRSLAAVRLLETCVLLALVLRACRSADRADLHRFAHGFLALVAASVVLGLVHPMEAYPLQVGRFTWLRIHPITAGVYVGLATLIGLAYTCARGPRAGPVWPRWAYPAALALVSYGLLATRTRNAVLGAVVGGGVLLFCLYRGRRRTEVFLCLGVLAVLLALLAVGPVTAYFARGEEVAQLATLNSRTSLWTAAVDAVRLQPLFGYGMSASRGIFLDETGLGGGHNGFVNVAVDLGLVGLAVWCGWLVALVRGAVVAPVREGAGLDRALVLGVLAFLLVDGFFFEGIGAAANVAGDWLFFCTAWVVVLRRRRTAPVPVGAGVPA